MSYEMCEGKNVSCFKIFYMNENLYDIIGVDPSASREEIKQSYKKLVRLYHPDVNKGSENYFKQINYAFDVLLDENKRQEYNVSLNIQQLREATQSIDKKPAFMAFYIDKTVKVKRHNYFSTYTMLLKRKIRKIFKNAIKPVKGEDVFYTIEITQDEALFGTSKNVNILHKKECSKCRGRKTINGKPCTLCDNEGEIVLKKRIRVNIPPNTQDGARTKIANEGKFGKKGGANGDLYLIIRIKK